jgi:hypothetical protein
MKKTLTILLAALLANCSTCDPIGGTRESSDKPYSGLPAATMPHNSTPEFSVQQVGSCDSTGCTYTVMARVLLHNPTDVDVTADVACEFYLEEGYLAASNERTGILVKARSETTGTKAVEVQQMVTLVPGQTASIEGDCHVEW